VLDRDGVIQDVTLANDVSHEGVDIWRGRPWFETVSDNDGSKVLDIVGHARENGLSAFRQIDQRFPSGLELPIEYTIVRLGGNAGLIAIGRNLKAVSELQARLVSAQQAMEQDYWKLREVESRYRMLFDASNEAVVLLSGDMLKILEANPAAIRLSGLVRGRDLLSEMRASEREPFQAMLTRVRQSGRAPGMLVHLGPAREAWMARASLLPSEPGSAFMIQLAQAGPNVATEQHAEQMSLDVFVDRLPDAFVVIDRDGVVRRANRAFLDLVQLGAEAAVLGEQLSRWLARPGADLSVLLTTLNRMGSVRLFTTELQGELGGKTEIEISAVGNLPARPTLISLLVRDVGRRLSPSEGAASVRSALGAIIEQTGKTSLPVLVKDAVGLVERHYIAAALQLAEGNRTAAAEILGLSRQGFYKKLAQYEIDGHSRPGADLDK
jgi:transcriptional regulator PpsR